MVKRAQVLERAAILTPIVQGLAGRRRRARPLGVASRAETLSAWLLVSPALLGFVLFHAWPALRVVQFSFTDWNLLREPAWVGKANYARMLEDGTFWNAMQVSALHVLLNIPLQTALALFLAVAMHRLTQSLFVRSVVLLPYLLSNVLVALVWLWLLDPLLGWINHAVMALGLERQPFFGGTAQALATVAGVNSWRHIGMVGMLFLAGLASIPRPVYEAARLEGATEWQMFRRVTLPLLRPVMAFVLVSGVTGSFQTFDVIAVATQGGPLDHTRVIVHYIVQSAFGFYRMGYASAMAVVLCAVTAAYALLQMRMLQASESELA